MVVIGVIGATVPVRAADLIKPVAASRAIDTLSLDNGRSKTFAFHVAMLESNRYQIENLANLDALPATGATVVVGVLPVGDGSQAEARIIALPP
jgi:kynurenine formamidase